MTSFHQITFTGVKKEYGMVENMVKTYILSGSTAEVLLDIDFNGLGYTSTSAVSVDYQSILSDHRGPLAGKVVGRNNQLHTKILRITSTITNTTNELLNTGICVSLRGGVAAKEYQDNQQLGPRESLTYHVEITLYQM